MRKVIFAAAFAAIIISAATGCSPKGSSEMDVFYSKPLKIEEKEGGVITVTEYEWNENASPAGQVKKRGSEVIYEDADYVYDGRKVTFNRSHYENGAVSYVEKHVEEYYDEYWLTVISSKIYRDDELNPVESTETSYNREGYRDRFVHKKNGTIYLEESNFNYEPFSVTYNISGTSVGVTRKSVSTYQGPNYTGLDEIVVSVLGDDSNVISRKKYEYQSGYLKGYKLYNGGSEKPSEEMTNYKASGRYNVLESRSFDTIWYDETGAKTREVSTSESFKIFTAKIRTEY